MTDSGIPDQVRRFLLTAIPSVPHLEALLLLRAAPAVRWQAATLAQRLYVDDGRARVLLRDLIALGLAQSHADGSHAFAPRDRALAATVDQLATVYAQHVTEVAKLIHAKSDPKARQFADAFRWRKEP